jgi:hypothetical protein
MRKPLQLVVLAVGALLVYPELAASERMAAPLAAPNPPRVQSQDRATQAQQQQQQRRRQQAGQQEDQRPGKMRGPGKGSGPGRGDEPFLERLRRMSPEQQQRFLNENPRFRGLPPERQARIRENLRRWNSLTPQQQEALIRREEQWRQMTPEQRQRVRSEIMPQWRQLEPQRRQALMRRLRVLAPLSDEERAARLADENFLRGLDDSERALLRDLAELRLPPPDQDGPDSDQPPDL